MGLARQSDRYGSDTGKNKKSLDRTGHGFVLMG
jgi:hypothetical protein